MTQLPERRGPRPSTTPSNPHTQLDQQPDDSGQRALLASLHAMLPPDLVADAIAAGWAETHPVARLGLIPGTAVMLYAPRDDAEREVVKSLVEASHAFARGDMRVSAS